MKNKKLVVWSRTTSCHNKEINLDKGVGFTICSLFFFIIQNNILKFELHHKLTYYKI